MSRTRRSRWPVNPPYPTPKDPPGYVPPEPDPDETVPVDEIQQEAMLAFRHAQETTDSWFASPLGLVFKAVCGVMAILIVISLGILVLVSIWGVIWS